QALRHEGARERALAGALTPAAQAAGSVITKQVRLEAGSSSRVPPLLSMSEREMPSPRPECEPDRVEWKRSKIHSRAEAGTPSPESSTWMRTRSPCRATETSTSFRSEAATASCALL